MKYYDQLDVIPIFMTSFLVFGIVCGFVFLDEWKLYSWLSGLGIFSGVSLCIAGITLIVLKNAKVAKKNARRDMDELE